MDEKEAEINWDELREYDPSEYLKQKELHEARKEALAKAKSNRSKQSEQEAQAQAQAEVAKLVQFNNWIIDGKETSQYQSDMAQVKAYLDHLNIPESQQMGILTTGHGQVYIDAAKAHAAKTAKQVKKVRKTKVVTKPSGVRKPTGSAELEAAQAAHKKYGTPQTALALRKAQRKIKGN